MRTKVTIDDSLLARARFLSGLRKNSQLVKAALQALIQRECALRLASLAASQQEWKRGGGRLDFDL
jgi:Arc/MetJ family transcription regulator